MEDLPVITIDDHTNCSITTAKLIFDHFKLPPDQQHLHLLEGIDPSVSTDRTCGAIEGGRMALNQLVHKHGATAEQIHQAHLDFTRLFTAQYGSTNCGDIIGTAFNADAPVDMEQKLFCGELLDETTAYLIKIINQIMANINPIADWYNRH